MPRICEAARGDGLTGREGFISVLKVRIGDIGSGTAVAVFADNGDALPRPCRLILRVIKIFMETQKEGGKEKKKKNEKQQPRRSPPRTEYANRDAVIMTMCLQSGSRVRTVGTGPGGDFYNSRIQQQFMAAGPR